MHLIHVFTVPVLSSTGLVFLILPLDQSLPFFSCDCCKVARNIRLPVGGNANKNPTEYQENSWFQLAHVDLKCLVFLGPVYQT